MRTYTNGWEKTHTVCGKEVYYIENTEQKGQDEFFLFCETCGKLITECEVKFTKK